MNEQQRRTKRRYAHELYPHAAEGEVRPLSVEVPYLYARMVGFDLTGTGWMSVEPRRAAGDRTHMLIDAAWKALLADALSRGMTGDEAWAWAASHIGSDGLEVAFECAWAVLGDDLYRIKPYPCGPEPDHHMHPDEQMFASSLRWLRYAAGRESDCAECTEQVTP